MYNVEYDYDDYESNGNFNNNQRNNNYFNLDKKKIIVIVLIIILISILFVYQKRVNYYVSYNYLEDNMENETSNYIDDFHITSSKEIFIEARELNLPIEKDCMDFSGVFVDGNDYQVYLKCDDYESKIINNDNEYARLIGNSIVFLNQGMTYIESSYETLKDNVKVTINGTVGSEIGVYNLEYIIRQNSIFKGKMIRKVVVLDNDKINDLYPKITLLGDEIEYLKLRDKYIEKGSYATDKLDGTINNIKVIGEVNPNRDGEYHLKYVAINSKGYASSVSRKVIVLRENEKVSAGSMVTPTNITNLDVTIKVVTFGNNYLYTILPNGEITYEKSFEYKVSENGTYEFLVYDNDNNEIKEIVVVDNINKTKPFGTCLATVYSNYTDIEVFASSSIGISSYNYIINGKEYGFNESFTYRINDSKINSVSVKVKDIIGNVIESKCSIKYMDPSVNNPNIKYYVGFNDEYVIPKTKNNLDSFVGKVRGKISQNADSLNCGSDCLSVALYYAYYLQYGNMNAMNLVDACNYKYPIRFDTIYKNSKQDILKIIYDEIFAGRVISLQVDNNNQGRHFVLVVGYRRKVYNAADLKEEDLIYIDAWNGNLVSMKSGKRVMYNDTGRGGYRVDKIQSKYY